MPIPEKEVQLGMQFLFPRITRKIEGKIAAMKAIYGQSSLYQSIKESFFNPVVLLLKLAEEKEAVSFAPSKNLGGPQLGLVRIVSRIPSRPCVPAQQGRK